MTTLKDVLDKLDFDHQMKVQRIQKKIAANDGHSKYWVSDLERTQKFYDIDRERTIKLWEKQALEEKSRAFDKDFLMGVGLFYETVAKQYEHPEINVVGYLEIHQWQNSGKQQIIDGFTTFRDVIELGTEIRWWRKRPGADSTKANEGYYRYAIKMGGLLELLNFNSDSSD